MAQEASGLRRSRWFVVIGAAVLMGIFLRVAEQPAPAAGNGETSPVRQVAIFGHGGDPNLSFSSQIVLLNQSVTASIAGVATFDANGDPAALLRGFGDQATPSMSVQIPGSGTATIESHSDDPTRILSGWAEVFSFNDKVGLQAVFSIFSNDRLAARAQVPGRRLRMAGSFLAANQGQTGVAIVNPLSNTETAEVRLGTANADGCVFDTTALFLDPGQQVSMFLDQLLSTTGATSVEFRSNVPVAILPLQQEGLVLTTQELFPARDVESLFRDECS